jgi:hypothetical protein
MATRSKAPLPLPADELLRMKEYLSPHYGSQVWQDGERRVLVLRVPGEDPDMVNDVEASVEHLSPGDVHDLQGVLMVGSRSTVMMAVHPFRDLMQARIVADREQCRQARARLGSTLGHLLYRAQDDTRRLWRLAVRIRKAHVAELDDAELERLADELGPHLRKPGYAEVQIVYLVADQDDVRIEAALFLQDLQDRHADVERQARKEAEEAARAAAEKAKARAERERILKEMEARFKPRVVHAPLARITPGRWEAADEQPAPSADESPRGTAASLRDTIRGIVDAVTGAPPEASGTARASLASTSSGRPPSGGRHAASPSLQPGEDASYASPADAQRQRIYDELERLPAAGPSAPGPGPTFASSLEGHRSVGAAMVDAPRPAHPGFADGAGASARVAAARPLPDDLEAGLARLGIDVARPRAAASPSGAAYAPLAPASALGSGSFEASGAVGAGSASANAATLAGLEAPSRLGLQHARGGATVATPQPPEDPALLRLRDELEGAGFRVRVRPAAGGHEVHLAAERDEGYPARVIARCEPVVTNQVAEQALAAARELEVDIVLLLAPEIEADARRRIIATKAKHVTPEQLSGFVL